MNSQGGSTAWFCIVDSGNNIVALQVFTVSAIGQLDVLHRREIMEDVAMLVKRAKRAVDVAAASKKSAGKPSKKR